MKGAREYQEDTSSVIEKESYVITEMYLRSSKVINADTIKVMTVEDTRDLDEEVMRKYQRLQMLKR